MEEKTGALIEPRACELGMRNTTGSSIPGSLFFLPLVKGNEDSGYDFENRTGQRVLFVIQGF